MLRLDIETADETQPKWTALLDTYLSEVIETATSTYLGALDKDEQETARLFIQKAAQTTDESWQHTVSGQQGPGVAGPTIASLGRPGSASQDDDSDDMDLSVPRKSRLSGPQPKRSSHDSLTGHVSDA